MVVTCGGVFESTSHRYGNARSHTSSLPSLPHTCRSPSRLLLNPLFLFLRPAQARFVALPATGRWQPVRAGGPATGIMVMRDTQPGEPVELVVTQGDAAAAAAAPAAAAAAAPAAAAAAPAAAQPAAAAPASGGDGDEPPPPAPFTYDG